MAFPPLLISTLARHDRATEVSRDGLWRWVVLSMPRRLRQRAWHGMRWPQLTCSERGAKVNDKRADRGLARALGVGQLAVAAVVQGGCSQAALPDISSPLTEIGARSMTIGRLISGDSEF